jgi:phenylalanine-4-hydroxylase
MQYLPPHLKKYIVEQDYEKYTWADHAVWRYILRQLKSFLGRHAHESYLGGLDKTGIEIEKIPRIEDISKKLEKFGWRALPVSGFIPPAAFMELQSLSVLPIASDMRSIDHLLYTPAPDIVHEAAGHAPIIADPEYAAYLKEYALVAKKAIISKEDMQLYKAIRELSDIKENPGSKSEDISLAEKKLSEISRSIRFISEATELSRMNWWTAEYGLIGPMHSPKIFGAGLLSSVGESKWCLSEKVKKVYLNSNCIKQPYDITEPQPQLFVAESFKHLSKVLDDLAQTMAFKTGGESGLKKALQAETVNTVQLDSEIQISGVLVNYLKSSSGDLAYLQFKGPTQLCFAEKQLSGHGPEYHKLGYGTPIGKITSHRISDLKVNSTYELNWESGVKLSGKLVSLYSIENAPLILSFENAVCKFDDKILFQPEWGMFDIVLGENVKSVFGGPADRSAFGATEDFIASKVIPPKYTKSQLETFEKYFKIRKLRESKKVSAEEVHLLFDSCLQDSPTEWLLFVELFELCCVYNLDENTVSIIKKHLVYLQNQSEIVKTLVEEGMNLAHEKN